MSEGVDGDFSSPAISAYDFLPMPYGFGELSLIHSSTCRYWSPATLCLIDDMT